jgi:hypothetical protein
MVNKTKDKHRHGDGLVATIDVAKVRILLEKMSKLVGSINPTFLEYQQAFTILTASYFMNACMSKPGHVELDRIMMTLADDSIPSGDKRSSEKPVSRGMFG